MADLSEPLKSALKKYEAAIISAWVYDTELGYKDNYGALQAKRSQDLFLSVEKAERILIDEILEFGNKKNA